ncbi:MULTISPECIES: primosomal protein N' [Deefgea]|uniref:Replication restart protein PriA n=1 Tax=Deefgea chitinilytica TaxID=570276 RepID=A0ABS2C7S7_9NEIS|nr:MULTISPECIES: primosomal protein N' [Deefgea]MBM5570206.1 primosomal protein N' [Deefgea chitinilytica]MBM9887435.1 primosomal protein N' [Deefgea sp. CFH1-16]
MASFALVALDVPLKKLFAYEVANFTVAVGSRVLVPFGPRRLSGVVMQLRADAADFTGTPKSILAVFNDLPALPQNTLQLCQFVADYYHYPIGAVISAALPTVFRANSLFSEPAASTVYFVEALESLLSQISKRAPAQRRVAEALLVPHTPAALRRLHDSAWRWVKAWHEAGWVQSAAEEKCVGLASAALPLNVEQSAAVAELVQASGFSPFLLYGITGSGKTEVYLQTIAQVLARGLQVLVLIPEINLTPQLEGRFRARFPGVRMAALHSGLNNTERAVNWLAALRGEAQIVLGTRLAVFTPLPKLGMIIVDEEHDPSFKQQEGLRYSARDVAVYRARQANVPIVLGSATPSIESWANAKAKRYRLLPLTQRAVPGAVLPKIVLLPTKNVSLVDGLHVMALAAMHAALERGEQVLIFLNRRGFSPVLQCGECGWMASCSHCSARLVLHLKERRLRCHHCGHEEAITAACPDCGNHDLKPVGQGTQRLEDALPQHFPGKKILRIDRDSTCKKGELDAALAQVHSGDADILIGTQMLAKGHDFDQLNCVVVLNADTGLYSVDFRAEERLFALLTQVAGRAGRRENPGEVFIQTAFSDHPFYHQLLARDYAPFADRTLAERNMLLLPPANAWALFRADAPELEQALAALSDIRKCISPEPDLVLNQPVAATMLKKAGVERAQLLIAAKSKAQLQAVLGEALPTIQALKLGKVRWTLDVDPVEV